MGLQPRAWGCSLAHGHGVAASCMGLQPRTWTWGCSLVHGVAASCMGLQPRTRTWGCSLVHGIAASCMGLQARYLQLPRACVTASISTDCSTCRTKLIQYCTLTPASSAAAPICRSHARPAVALCVSSGSLSCWKFIQSCSYTLSCQPCERALPKRLSQNSRPRGSAKPDLLSSSKRHCPPFCTA